MTIKVLHECTWKCQMNSSSEGEIQRQRSCGSVGELEIHTFFFFLDGVMAIFSIAHF